MNATLDKDVTIDSNKNEQNEALHFYIEAGENAGNMVVQWTSGIGFTYISSDLRRLFSGNYDGRNLFSIWLQDDVVHEDEAQTLKEIFICNANERQSTGSISVRLRGKAGGYLWCKIGYCAEFDDNNEMYKLYSVTRNEDEAVCSRKLLEYRALYDTLTGIYNAQSFYKKAHLLVRKNPMNKYAVLRGDLSKFKFVNELYGMDEGDKLLCKLAAVLEEAAGANGIPGRINSDVFALCVPYDKTEQLEELIKKITDEMAEYGTLFAVHIYFGICIIDNNKVPMNVLCDRAGLALEQIKGKLLCNYAYYDNELRNKELSERNIENEMEGALANGEFQVFLQPKHSLLTGKPIGAEALVRWQHPFDGLKCPAEFVPLFEKNGFIVKLDEFVWETVFKTLSRWIKEGKSPVPVSVNVSRVHIYNADFAQRVSNLMKKYDVPGYLVELELTETTFVENPEDLERTFVALQKLGLNFSIDDFGSGYSSLNMLKNSPAGILKLDREFLGTGVGDEKAKTVVRHTISMANQLNMQVVAEGVETAEQASFLTDAGCLAAQGYFYSRPMPIPEYEKLMLYTN